MAIKVGDIVEYMGVRQRVMSIYRDGTVSLSKCELFTFQPLSELTLVESVELPTIKTGDVVIIKNIPEEEQAFAYPREVSFILRASKDQQPFIVEDIDDGAFGPCVYLRINGTIRAFYAYCLEKVNHYDMI